MDNVAHTLAGAVLAEAGLKKRTALGTATLLIAANLPDLDIVAMLFDQSLAFRRGWTHGVLALFVLPLVLTLGMLAWSHFDPSSRDSSAPPVRPIQILLLSFIGVFSHPVLDWLNTYGLRWLMPFDGTWFYGDALFIVDPWLWLILLFGVFAARRRRDTRPGGAAVALALVYMGLMVLSSVGGRRLVEEGLRAEGLQSEEVMVGPVPLNPNRRQVIVKVNDNYLRGTLDWLPKPRLRIFETIVAINADHPAAIVAAQAPEVQGFLGWARYPYYQVRQQGERYTVLIDDLRYSDGRSPSWAAVRVEVGGQVVPGTRQAFNSAETGAPYNP